MLLVLRDVSLFVSGGVLSAAALLLLRWGTDSPVPRQQRSSSSSGRALGDEQEELETEEGDRSDRSDRNDRKVGVSAYRARILAMHPPASCTDASDRNDRSDRSDRSVEDALTNSAYASAKESVLQMLGYLSARVECSLWTPHSASDALELWTSQVYSSGILLRGRLKAPSSDPASVYNWIVARGLDIGFACESVVRSEVLHSSKQRTIRRVTLRVESSHAMELLLCTCVERLSNGCIGVYTISIPSSDTYPVSAPSVARAHMHGSGFLIHPVAPPQTSGSTASTLVEFALYLETCSSSSKVNIALRKQILASYVQASEHLRLNKREVLPSIRFIALFPEEGDRLRTAALSAVEALRLITEVEEERVWRVISTANGIAVSEQDSQLGSKGFFRARCSVQASMSVLRELLCSKLESIDGLLESRQVLASLGEGAEVQLLTYGPIWPVGAREYLIATANVSMPCTHGEGFIISSTSVDDVCVEEDAHVHAAGAPARSLMRLAGFVGTPNSDGSIDLQLFVDADVCALVPVWVARVLAQFGLSEMMTRVRMVASGIAVNPRQRMEEYTEILRLKAASIEAGEPESLEEEARAVSPVHALRGLSTSGHSSVSDVPEMLRKLSTGSATSPANQLLRRNSMRGDQAVAVAEVARKYHAMYFSGTSGSGFKLDWKEKVNKQGVLVVASVVDGSDWLAIKATVTISADMDAVRTLLLDDSKVGLYDDMFDNAEFIATIDDRTAIRRMKFKGIWPTAPRDFVVLTTWSEHSDGSVWISSKAAPDGYFPLKSEYVRGNIVFSGYVLRQRGNDCDITLIAHTELGGTLPVSIINMLSATAPFKMLVGIRAITAKKSK